MLLMIEKPRSTAADRFRATLARSAGTLLTAVDAVFMWPFRTSENRRLVDTLAGMSDHALKDIGLTRQDLRDSTALPIGHVASSFLAGRRAARRFHR